MFIVLKVKNQLDRVEECDELISFKCYVILQNKQKVSSFVHDPWLRYTFPLIHS